MKVGILTFHAQRNYGGVLQAWALQTAIEKLGHEVIVIDRQLSKNGRHLKGPGFSWSLDELIKFSVRRVLGIANTELGERSARTIKFVHSRLHLSAYSFFSWTHAPKNLGVDAIVVGSDQVWHVGKKWGDPKPYLLLGAPERIPTISYAASFGMRTIPENLKQVYREGLSKFSSISVREREGVALVEAIGFKATHVVDPTLLVARQQWVDAYGGGTCEVKHNAIVFYLFETIDAFQLQTICETAEAQNRLLVFMSDMNIVRIPKSLKELLLYWRVCRRYLNKVCFFKYSTDPSEFVVTILKGEALVTDSFHGLMFSAILARPVKVLEPHTIHRKVMFSRIDEFTKNAKGEIYSDSVVDAVKSIVNGSYGVVDVLDHQEEIEKSRQWLSQALATLKPHKK